MATTLVTGSSTGIGYATAIALARAGHDVIGTMRSPEQSPQLAEIAAAESLPITILPLDVDSDASVASAIEAAQGAKGPIEALVNNAGIGQTFAVEDAAMAEFRQTMETNFFGALRCIKALLPGMRERGQGCIVNVTSVAGRIAVASQGPYCSSKFALEGLSEALATEVQPFGIRVAVVEPGVIATPIFNKLHDALSTPYSGERRVAAMFAASQNAGQVPPSVVGEKIRDIVAGEAPPTLRHPVGPDAEPFLEWRAGMTDEQWIAYWGGDDDEWASRLQADFGLDVRPYLGQTPAGIVTG